MSVIQKNNQSQGKKRSSGIHLSTKTLKRGKPKSKASKYWRRKIAEAYKFHSKMFVTPKDIISKIKWLTKNRPTKGTFSKKTTKNLRKTAHPSYTKAKPIINWKAKDLETKPETTYGGSS